MQTFLRSIDLEAMIVRWRTEAEEKAAKVWSITWDKKAELEPAPPEVEEPIALPAPPEPKLLTYRHTDEHLRQWKEHERKIAHQRFGREPDPTFF